MPADMLAVGLGNPGKQYAGTRHNAGADVIALLAERHGGSLKLQKKDRALADAVTVEGKRLAVAFPQTYMNESGVSVVSLAKHHGLLDAPERIVIVHDELDLPLGRLRVKAGGGLAGHNGLRSIKSHLHSDAFLRVRIGIGKPPGGKEQGADHVLSKPSKRDREELAIVVQEAADAVECILHEGVERAMNRFNGS